MSRMLKIQRTHDVLYLAENRYNQPKEMFKFIAKCSKKDKMELSDDDIQLILDGEYEYGKSLGIYKEDTFMR